jgi:hypothetical protein
VIANCPKLNFFFVERLQVRTLDCDIKCDISAKYAVDYHKKIAEIDTTIKQQDIVTNILSKYQDNKLYRKEAKEEAWSVDDIDPAEFEKIFAEDGMLRPLNVVHMIKYNNSSDSYIMGNKAVNMPVFSNARIQRISPQVLQVDAVVSYQSDSHLEIHDVGMEITIPQD